MTSTNHIAVMKNKALFLATLSAAIFAVGCDKKPTAAQQLDKVQQKTAEVAQDMRDFTYAQKNEFVATMRAQLAALNKELDELAVKIETSSAAVRADAQPRINRLREQTARMNQQLDDATNATESNWEAFKGDVKKAYDSSRDGLRDARQWLSEKIAP